METAIHKILIYYCLYAVYISLRKETDKRAFLEKYISPKKK